MQHIWYLSNYSIPGKLISLMIIFLSTSKLGNWSMFPTPEFQNQLIFYPIPMSGSDMVSNRMRWAASGPCDSNLWQKQEKAAVSAAIEWLRWQLILQSMPEIKSHWEFLLTNQLTDYGANSTVPLIYCWYKTSWEKYGSGFISVLEAGLKTVTVLHKAPQEYIPENLHCRTPGRHSAQCIF